MEKAFYLAIGTELLKYKINKYIPLLSQKLNEIGIELDGEITVKDDLNSIVRSIKFASEKSKIIIITGGLGPTRDDLTRKALSKYLNIPLIFCEKVAKLLSKYGDIQKDNYLRNQCYVLKNAKIIENKNGTAQGEVLKIKGKTYILLPGPLNEWEPMWEKIKHYIKKTHKTYSIIIKIADLKESDVEKTIFPILLKFKNSLKYNILAGANIVELNISSNSHKIIKKIKNQICNLIKENIYSTKNEKLEEVLGNILVKKRLTLSTAESCTSGLLASRITDVAGSSRYYLGGVNTYSNDTKIKILGVKKETISRYGAVSEETAKEMLKGIKNLIKSDCAIAITGIAGPTGGSEEKPVGTVFIAVSFKDKINVVKKNFTNKDRIFIKNASVNTAMWLLYKMIK